MSLRMIVTVLLVPLAAAAAGPASQNPAPDKRIVELLGPIREAQQVPALAGAIVTDAGLQAVGAVGVRKAGTDVAVTVDDLWHLGSDTKAMTAALIGRLVEEGKLKWDTTMETVFPEFAALMNPEFGKVTILHLLSHRAGLPPNIPWGLIPMTEPIRDQRLRAVKAAVSAKLVAEPGAKFIYSNLGYVVAGAAAERVTDETWENLLLEKICRPLGMTAVGFGGVGTPGEFDQPWGHGDDGKPVRENGPDADNPPVMGPAGRVHCTVADWAKFVADQLRGARGEKALLGPDTYKRLQRPEFGGDYAMGWLAVEREWGGGTVLTHAGSNTMNLAVAWLAPLRQFAVLLVTNQAGHKAQTACDQAAGALIKLYTEK